MSLKLIHLWFLPPLMLAFAAGSLYALNIADKWQVHRMNSSARQMATPPAEIFNVEMIAELPAVAQRFFTFSIQPGAKLRTRVRLHMQGELGLGDNDAPGYFPFTARQTIVPEKGFTWALRSNGLPMVIGGSDVMWGEQSWTRFWLYGLMPVAREGGTKDHFRAAEGRYLIELAAWSPAALLPQNNVEWEEIDAKTARAWITTSTGRHGIEISMDARGAPTAYRIKRWSNANPAGTFQYQPFGGTPEQFIDVDGIRVAQKVNVGNHFGTPDYFPFFKAELTKIEFF